MIVIDASTLADVLVGAPVGGATFLRVLGADEQQPLDAPTTAPPSRCSTSTTSACSPFPTLRERARHATS
jgi:hypothetical protein